MPQNHHSLFGCTCSPTKTITHVMKCQLHSFEREWTRKKSKYATEYMNRLCAMPNSYVSSHNKRATSKTSISNWTNRSITCVNVSCLSPDGRTSLNSIAKFRVQSFWFSCASSWGIRKRIQHTWSASYARLSKYVSVWVCVNVCSNLIFMDSLKAPAGAKVMFSSRVEWTALCGCAHSWWMFMGEHLITRFAVWCSVPPLDPMDQCGCQLRRPPCTPTWCRCR